MASTQTSTAGIVAGSGRASRPPRPWRADLRTGRPDPRLFPVVAWRRSALSALQAAPPGYGDPAGLPSLRVALAAWVGRSRGVVAGPEHVVVTAGAQGAFDLLARTVLAPTATVAVENPGYPPAWRAFRNAGARLLPVPVDPDGMVVDHIPPNGLGPSTRHRRTRRRPGRSCRPPAVAGCSTSPAATTSS